MRGLAAVAIGILSIGIGVTTTMFGVVYAALFRPLPFSESALSVVPCGFIQGASKRERPRGPDGTL